jgi:hypothetical protein
VGAVSLARADLRRLPWREAEPGNIRGVARALTAIGPLGPGPRYWLLQLAFLARRYIAPYRKKKAADLRRLSFVHFARWVLIHDLPQPDGTSRHRLKPTYMLFESNFNGGFEEYIDAFADILTPAMKVLFGAAYNFPGPQPSGPFKDFIRRHDYEAEHFYSAYDDTTSTDVGRAVKVEKAFQRLCDDTAGAGAEEFARRWRAFLTEVEGCL